MENKITDKEKVKDLKVKDDIRKGNPGKTKDGIKLDDQDKSNPIPHDPKIGTRNAQNTVYHDKNRSMNEVPGRNISGKGVEHKNV